MSTILKKIHHIVPTRIRHLYSPIFWIIIDVFNKYIKTFGQMYQALYVIEGLDANGQHSISLCYFGNSNTTRAHWIQRIFAPEYKTHNLGKKWIFGISNQLKKNNLQCSVQLNEINWFTDLCFFNNKGFKVPIWLQMGIDIPKPFSEMTNKEKGGVCDVERRIRMNDLTYEIKNDPNAFEDFYYNMHVPLIKDRHDDAAVFYTEPEARKIFESSDLFIVKKDDVAIGGTLVQKQKNITKMRLIGVTGGKEEYFRLGVTGALYYFPLVELQKNGIKQLDVGGSGPILSDGLNKFKMALNAKIIPHTHMHKRSIKLLLKENTPAIQNFLLANPFVFYKNKCTPQRALFIDSTAIQTKKDLQKAFKYSNCNGLQNTDIYVYGDLGEIQNWHNELKLTDSSIKSAEKIFTNSL